MNVSSFDLLSNCVLCCPEAEECSVFLICAPQVWGVQILHGPKKGLALDRLLEIILGLSQSLECTA